jgi:hypothetical protein
VRGIHSFPLQFPQTPPLKSKDLCGIIRGVKGGEGYLSLLFLFKTSKEPLFVLFLILLELFEKRNKKGLITKHIKYQTHTKKKQLK